MKAHAGRFLVEFDGVAVLRATKVTGLKKTHEPFEILTGDTDSTEYGRGKYKCEPIEITQAQALNSAGREVAQYFDDFTRGYTTEKRNFQFIQLKDDGQTTHGVTEALRCTPLEFSVSDADASSKDPATWMLKLQPEDIIFDIDG